MFQIGDKIFYPMHGGGIISAIEEKEVLGETRTYYVLNLLHKNMLVMIPVDKSACLRQIVSRDKMDTLLSTFYDGETDLNIPINRRPNRNLEKIKSGDIAQVAEVIRDLVRINNHKKLGALEKTMLSDVIQLLVSEVILVNQMSLEEASALVDQVITLPVQ